MNYIRCPKCQAEIEADSLYCDQCGAELFVCPKCGTFGKGKRCTRCGEPLISAKELSKAPSVAQTPPSAAPSPSPSSASPSPAAPSTSPAVPSPSLAAPVSSSLGSVAGGSSASIPPPASIPLPASNSSITADVNRLISGISPSASPGATIRPGAPVSPSPSPQRQVPGHLVCRSPQLRLYIDDVIIGRREGGYASVFASFGMVSGRHAQISRAPSGGWQVTDLGSTNGTRLNGSPLLPNVPTPFWVGDTISFANVDFEAIP